MKGWHGVERTDKKINAETLYDAGLELQLQGRYKQALVQYRAAAALGHARSMFAIGSAYEAGQGVARSMSDAYEWYKRATDAGDIDATFNMANGLRDGLREAGVLRDRDESIRLYRVAAEAGHLNSMSALAILLGDADKDDPEQVVVLNRAIELGCANAMSTLGVLYKNGHGGLEKDVAAAVSWFRKAADQGNPAAMYNLAYQYEQGTAIEKSVASAAMWYRRALATGLRLGPAESRRVSQVIAADDAVKRQAGDTCSTCAAPAPTFTCSGCQQRKFCSKACQRADWQEHKAECKAIQAARLAQ